MSASAALLNFRNGMLFTRPSRLDSRSTGAGGGVTIPGAPTVGAARGGERGEELLAERIGISFPPVAASAAADGDDNSGMLRVEFGSEFARCGDVRTFTVLERNDGAFAALSVSCPAWRINEGGVSALPSLPPMLLLMSL